MFGVPAVTLSLCALVGKYDLRTRNNVTYTLRAMCTDKYLDNYVLIDLILLNWDFCRQETLPVTTKWVMVKADP